MLMNSRRGSAGTRRRNDNLHPPDGTWPEPRGAGAGGVRTVLPEAAGLLIGLLLGVATLVALPADAAPLRGAAAPECTNSHMTAAYRGRDAATSHVRGRIVLKNTSDEACWVRGYGGLSYVGGGNGTQLGAAADRTASTKPRTLVSPGDKVRSPVIEASYGPYPKKKCKPRAVDGFRVYLPDETRSQFVPHTTTGCANPEVHLLSHKAYR